MSRFFVLFSIPGRVIDEWRKNTPPEKAKALYEEFTLAMQNLGIRVSTGIFQAIMSVELVNEGPVTILLDSEKTF